MSFTKAITIKIIKDLVAQDLIFMEEEKLLSILNQNIEKFEACSANLKAGIELIGEVPMELKKSMYLSFEAGIAKTLEEEENNLNKIIGEKLLTKILISLLYHGDSKEFERSFVNAYQCFLKKATEL